eukprot:Unigene11309_Nuclearia_a/m.34555 Unigene11309_Nuclearia_a/g.34555  ORF Unigene11309_Nuclearia_a/g.34555 Unigene11309_Nuclearia_a/m.34555 type:complete len:378 (-) Unigene11309_Nuclearia_a:2-1135(-)
MCSAHSPSDWRGTVNTNSSLKTGSTFSARRGWVCLVDLSSSSGSMCSTTQGKQPPSSRSARLRPSMMRTDTVTTPLGACGSRVVSTMSAKMLPTSRLSLLARGRNIGSQSSCLFESLLSESRRSDSCAIAVSLNTALILPLTYTVTTSASAAPSSSRSNSSFHIACLATGFVRPNSAASSASLTYWLSDSKFLAMNDGIMCEPLGRSLASQILTKSLRVMRTCSDHRWPRCRRRLSTTVSTDRGVSMSGLGERLPPPDAAGSCSARFELELRIAPSAAWSVDRRRDCWWWWWSWWAGDSDAVTFVSSSATRPCAALSCSCSSAMRCSAKTRARCASARSASSSFSSCTTRSVSCTRDSTKSSAGAAAVAPSSSAISR